MNGKLPLFLLAFLALSNVVLLVFLSKNVSNTHALSNRNCVNIGVLAHTAALALGSARERALSSLPPGSDILKAQLAALDSQIRKLDRIEDNACTPPK